MELSHLNPSQRAAVEHVDGPLLILAGAGSGKTRVVTHRVARLLELGVPPDRIVALSFTNKAAGEMRERLSVMVGKKLASELVLSTFHSLGVRMLREDPAGFGLDSPRFSILDQGDVFGLVRSLLREHGHHGGGVDRRFDIPAIAQRIGLWKNAFVDAHDVERHVVDEYDVVAAAIYEPYEDRLRSLGAVDFDDLVCLVARNLRDDPEVRARWQAKFDYVTVDEYQDTNDAQFELLRQLVPEPHNLCVVGDDDQAIYGWRGAKVENILHFDRVFANTTVVKLEENYRSRAPILEAANGVVSHNKARHDKKLVVTKRGGEPVTVVVAADGAEEASWVGKEIRKLMVDFTVHGTEIAVLYRSALQAKAIEEELQQHGIEYRVLGGQSMYDKKEVKDALAYLKAIVTPRDELSVRRALETPPRGIGRRTMQLLSKHAATRNMSLMDAVHGHQQIEGVPPRAAAALGRFSALVRGAQARAHADSNASAALRQVLESIDFRDHVRRETGSDQATDHRMGGVEWLLGSVSRYEERVRGQGKKPRWHEYFGTVSLDRNAEKPADKDADKPPLEREAKGKVTLATLHSAKGLEWDHVFIIGAEDGTMPHRRVAAPRASDAVSGDLEEERRLFYVGITRARERLWITRGASRIDRGREIPREPSRFLEELPDSVRRYEIEKEEELSSSEIGNMADAFLSMIRPPE
jgi:superfamily I DNA/RNA helicase